MNDTYELYANGGNLVDQCNKEMEADLSLADRASKTAISQEYMNFCLGLVDQCKDIPAFDKQLPATMKATIARANNCQDQLSAKDIELMIRLIEILEVRYKMNRELIDISVYFMKKIARTA